MRERNQKIFLTFLVISFLFAPSSLQAADFQTAWVKSVVDGDTLLLITGERVRFNEVDTSEVNKSQKLCRDAKGVEGIFIKGKLWEKRELI